MIKYKLFWTIALPHLPCVPGSTGQVLKKKLAISLARPVTLRFRFFLQILVQKNPLVGFIIIS